MKKNVIIVAIIVVALLGTGVAAYFIAQNDTESTASKQGDTMDMTGHEFKPRVVETSFVVSYKATSASGEETSGTAEVDKKGNSKYTASVNGEEVLAYNIDGDYISCTGDKCVQVSSENKEAISDYKYSEGDLDALRSKVVHKGEAACGSETCQLWEVNGKKTTTSFYINDNDELKMLKGTRADGTSYEITYEYKEVTVVRPDNVQKITIPKS